MKVYSGFSFVSAAGFTNRMMIMSCTSKDGRQKRHYTGIVMKRILILLIFSGMISALVFAQTQEEINKWELTRSDPRAQKVQLITKNMEFSVEESTAFWPIYDKYQAELNKLGD